MAGLIAHDELSRRRPVWEALSAFFLDTALDDSQLREIAAILHASGYTESQLDDVLTTELAPLLYPNLCIWVTVAGVWNGFDVTWIERQVLTGKHRAVQKWYNWGNRFICNRVVRGVKEHYWYRVLAFLRDNQSEAAN
jgi:hypothetical protein